MPSDDAIIAVAAALCLFLGVVLAHRLVRYIVRREVKWALTSLRNAKFALTVRDPKTGRFV